MDPTEWRESTRTGHVSGLHILELLRAQIACILIPAGAAQLRRESKSDSFVPEFMSTMTSLVVKISGRK